MRVNLIQKFTQLESASGIILFIMAVTAMLWANSPLAFLHQQFVSNSLFVINEGLMALFFLLVGMELKRGFLDGQLSKPSQVMLPAFAALGGMIAPALVYCALNLHNPIALKGWSTPVATDIAFALGALSLFKRVPLGLKLFLLALAIFDDLGAILIIAIFYSHGLALSWLFAAMLLVGLLFLFNRLNVFALMPYLVGGVLLWFCLLHSGIHPTLAGVFVAIAIPDGGRLKKSPLNRLEHALHPWVAYFIMPLFALANAGFSLSGISLPVLLDGVVLGITFGLLIGKQIGVFLFSWVLIKCKLAKLPEKTSWLMLYGVALLCGIGFTMSLFLGTLSFERADMYLAEVRLGVIIGSILSGLLGTLVLSIAFARNRS